jgi:hypothetical protein
MVMLKLAATSASFAGTELVFGAAGASGAVGAEAVADVVGAGAAGVLSGIGSSRAGGGGDLPEQADPVR